MTNLVSRLANLGMSASVRGDCNTWVRAEVGATGVSIIAETRDREQCSALLLTWGELDSPGHMDMDALVQSVVGRL